MADRAVNRVADAVAAAARAAPAEESARRGRRAGRSTDALGSEIRRRDLLPVLVLHLIQREPAYGNRLIEEIEALTEGVITVNPNTIYPLLRELEARGMIAGSWEHPDRRTRRYYSITSAGRREYGRLLAELRPFLDAVVRSVRSIKREIYGG